MVAGRNGDGGRKEWGWRQEEDCKRSKERIKRIKTNFRMKIV